MARTTLPPQPAAHEVQSQSHSHSQPETQTQTQIQTSSPSTMLVTALVMNLLTLICLILSASLMASNSTTIRVSYYFQYSVHYNDFYSYRYSLAMAVIGLAYTLLKLPFSINRVMTSGKLLSNHPKLLVTEFFGDKVVFGLLGAGVGAAFGVTVDLKKRLDSFDDGFELNGNIAFAPFRAKLDNFFSKAYFPAIFLLIAFLTCGVSSILSSLALMNTTPAH